MVPLGDPPPTPATSPLPQPPARPAQHSLNVGLPRPPKAPLESAAKEAKLVGRPNGSAGGKAEVRALGSRLRRSGHWAASAAQAPTPAGEAQLSKQALEPSAAPTRF